MNKIVLRIGAAVTAAASWGLLIAPASLADTGCSISGNGSNSHNTCNVTVNRGGNSCKKLKCASGSAQTNTAHVTNNVGVVSNTGGNKANKNTGGDVSITSGDSSVTVTITNTVNSNGQ